MKPRKFQFTRFLSPDLGIDLGTTRTRVWLPGEGVVVDEPSLVAVDQSSQKVLNRGEAVGNLANMLDGRTPGSVQILRPIRQGVVTDVALAEAMLRSFLGKARPNRWGLRPRLLVAVPSGLTPVERQAVITSATRAGARQVFLLPRPKAGAIGAGLPWNEPVASMICDVGGGTTEVAVLCLGELAVSESLRVAGNEMDQAIIDHLRRQHRLRIGEQMAERLKLEIGAVASIDRDLSLEVRGCDAVTGLPRGVRLTSDEVRESLADATRAIVRAVERALERCQPQQSADLMETGLALAGGGSQLRGLDRRLIEATGMPVRVVDDPHSCVVRGLGVCLENLDAWHGLIESRRAG